MPRLIKQRNQNEIGIQYGNINLIIGPNNVDTIRTKETIGIQL